jgi:carbon starvation protein
MLAATAKEIGEGTILSRTGGAPTLAVGMAQILHGLIPGEGMMAFWYHYAILFEALFILTTVDAGTRVARFMIQELLGLAYEPFRRTESWAANLACTAIAVALWGYFLYQGVVDPLGGINTLWPLFGIANQMLAGIALVFCSVVMVKMKREKFLWIPLIPTAWLLVCTLAAGWQKLFHEDPKIGFIANARKFADAAARGEVLAPAKSMEDMSRVVVNNYIDAGLCALFVTVVVAMVFFGIRAALAARASNAPTSKESDYVALDAVAR